ncbi:hypothetical protein LCGC14_2271250, partial [marine sediment metagenome]
ANALRIAGDAAVISGKSGSLAAGYATSEQFTGWGGIRGAKDFAPAYPVPRTYINERGEQVTIDISNLQYLERMQRDEIMGQINSQVELATSQGMLAQSLENNTFEQQRVLDEAAKNRSVLSANTTAIKNNTSAIRNPKKKNEDTKEKEPKPMAKGGIIDGPTKILAGEAGPEAFVPLAGGNIPVKIDWNKGGITEGGLGGYGDRPKDEIIDKKPVAQDIFSEHQLKIKEFRKEKSGWINKMINNISEVSDIKKKDIIKMMIQNKPISLGQSIWRIRGYSKYKDKIEMATKEINDLNSLILKEQTGFTNKYNIWSEKWPGTFSPISEKVSDEEEKLNLILGKHKKSYNKSLGEIESYTARKEKLEGIVLSSRKDFDNMYEQSKKNPKDEEMKASADRKEQTWWDNYVSLYRLSEGLKNAQWSEERYQDKIKSTEKDLKNLRITGGYGFAIKGWQGEYNQEAMLQRHKKAEEEKVEKEREKIKEEEKRVEESVISFEEPVSEEIDKRVFGGRGEREIRRRGRRSKYNRRDVEYIRREERRYRAYLRRQRRSYRDEKFYRILGFRPDDYFQTGEFGEESLAEEATRRHYEDYK